MFIIFCNFNKKCLLYCDVMKIDHILFVDKIIYTGSVHLSSKNGSFFGFQDHKMCFFNFKKENVMRTWSGYSPHRTHKSKEISEFPSLSCTCTISSKHFFLLIHSFWCRCFSFRVERCVKQLQIQNSSNWKWKCKFYFIFIDVVSEKQSRCRWWRVLNCFSHICENKMRNVYRKKSFFTPFAIIFWLAWSGRPIEIVLLLLFQELNILRFSAFLLQRK